MLNEYYPDRLAKKQQRKKRNIRHAFDKDSYKIL